MKYSKTLLLITKIFAIVIIFAYAIGLFRTYDTLQASAMLVIAILFSLEIVVNTKLQTKQ
ncbi:MAG: hypothetical protein ABWX94_00140 [Candidatus Saccharimonadales bacterium]